MHSWTTMTTCRMLHLLSLGMATAAAFTAPTTIHRSWTATTPIVRSVVAVPKSSPPTLAFASSKKDESTAATCSTTMNDIIIINGQNIALTPALVDYVNKRIGKTLSKLFTSGAIRECDVILSVSKNPKVKNAHRVEVVTNLKGTTIICKNESPDMYASIDAASHALSRKLCTYKERRTEGWHGGGTMGDDLAAALEEATADMDEDGDDINTINGKLDATVPRAAFEPVFKPEDDVTKAVTKVKSFQLDKAISLEEAIFALDYVDHDFYVFRNQATDQISVVYKRHTGGVGLVEP